MYELKITNLKKTYLLPGRGAFRSQGAASEEAGVGGGMKGLQPFCRFHSKKPVFYYTFVDFCGCNDIIAVNSMYAYPN